MVISLLTMVMVSIFTIMLIIKDNYDVNPTVTVEGNVDTRNMTDAQPIKVTATDSSGNQTSNDYEVKVADMAGPAITLKSDKCRCEVWYFI